VNVKKLQDKVALITGGTSGIGKAVVQLFASEGAKVIFTGRRKSHGEKLVSELQEKGFPAEFILCDHTKKADCEKVLEHIQNTYSRIDILFNNAGIVTKGTAETTTEQDWDQTMAINVTAVWRMCRLAIPLMRANGGGVIVNNGSDWAVVGAPNALPYAVSKGAVAQLTRSIALDHAAENIRVNAICPGDTFVERWLEKGYFEHESPVRLQDAIAEAASSLPMKRFAAPEEIARSVLFLASDDSSFMTGQLLVVDGGNTAR
jgi:NAD(P)-dependent dehydrogenase (short-subunit alcohol dehydrogenase family)